MSYLSEDKISTIVERVVERLQGSGGSASSAPPRFSSAATVNPPYGCGPRQTQLSSSHPHQHGVFSDISSAVTAATQGFHDLQRLGLKGRYAIIAAMRVAAHAQVKYMSEEAVRETGLGRVDQKILKNKLVIDKTPGPEILEPKAYTGDDGLTLEEWAPFGVIGAITPTTNPTETIICNAIGMIAAGNSVVFNVHPGAKRLSAYTVHFLNEAIVSAGGPHNLICCSKEPTIESAGELMNHSGIRLLVVTGGPGVVKAAMNSGKKVIAAGPGNPPCVVDETADLDQAAEGIVKGISLDNNIVCVAEKEILAVAQITDALKQKMAQHGAYELNPDERSRVEKLVISDNHVVKEWVGKDATAIAQAAGVQVPKSTLILYAEVPENHPFVQLELLTPVTGLVRCKDAADAIAAAVRCEHGNGHSASMYSRNIANLHAMARVINTAIFTKNAPTYSGLGLGGEGFTSFTIASPTGEGLTTARHFSKTRRCTLKEHFRIV